MNATRAQHSGFTYIGLMIVVAIMAVALTATAQLVSTEQRRERETELLFVGAQYARAIASYRAASSGAESYPTKLEDLLEDKRGPVMRRHLRRLYQDPITRSTNWGFVPGANNGIAGVYSQSTQMPLKQAGFPKEFQDFTGATAYNQWKFVAGTQGVAGGNSAQPGGMATGAPDMQAPQASQAPQAPPAPQVPVASPAE